MAVLSVEDSGKSWSLIIGFLNLNMLSFFIGSAFWPGVIIRLGYLFSAKITILGYFLSNALFVALLLGATNSVQFSIEFLVLIGVTRLFMGFFSSAFMPIAQGSIYAQTSCEQRQYQKLSKISGALTLGRLAGPGLVLLPVDWLWVLAIPFLPMFWSFFKRPSISFTGQEVELSPASKAQTLSLLLLHPSSLIAPLAIALSTTALVASFQLALAPEMTSLVGDAEQASEMLALLMLGLSMLLFILQVWVMPRLAKWLKTRLFIIAFGLVVFGFLAIMPDPILMNFYSRRLSSRAIDSGTTPLVQPSRVSTWRAEAPGV